MKRLWVWFLDGRHGCDRDWGSDLDGGRHVFGVFGEIVLEKSRKKGVVPCKLFFNLEFIFAVSGYDVTISKIYKSPK